MHVAQAFQAPGLLAAAAPSPGVLDAAGLQGSGTPPWWVAAACRCQTACPEPPLRCPALAALQQLHQQVMMGWLPWMSCLACRCCHAALGDCQLGFVIPSLHSHAGVLGGPAFSRACQQQQQQHQQQNQIWQCLQAAVMSPSNCNLQHKCTSHHMVKECL